MTTLWPVDSEGYYSYDNWGAGLGLNLLSNGTTNYPYMGPAKGLRIRFSGELNGQPLRIAFGQTTTDTDPPFVTTTTLGEKVVAFYDPNCPSWSTGCLDPTEHPYSLQIQVAGGYKGTNGPFEVCIESVVPVVDDEI